MTKKLSLSLVLVGLLTNSFASTTNEALKNLNQNRDRTINIYGVGAKTDKDQDSSAGMGIMFDSEAIKVKVEGTSDFIKSGAVLKLNPFNPNLYFKLGLNYINQKMYSPVNTSTRVNQYSGALSSGYMLRDDFYVEIGGAYTKLDGKVFGDYEIKDETTSLAYLEVAKRWNTPLGTLDTTANGGQVFHEYVKDEFSGGVGIDYYPMNNAKIGYNYQYEQNNIANIYSAQYSFFFVEYADNISLDTYQVNGGVKVAFDNLFDISTYKAPTNIKPHLSELHRFETITFATNMEVQSSAGVQKTQAAIDRDALPDTPANTAPVANDFSVDADDEDTVSYDMNAQISDNESADSALTITIVSGPTHGSLTWNGHTFTYEVTDGSGYSGDDSFTYKVTDPDGLESETKTVTIIDTSDH